MAWCVPSEAFWSYRDQLHVFYDRYWVTLDPWLKHCYMAIYGVL